MLYSQSDLEEPSESDGLRATLIAVSAVYLSCEMVDAPVSTPVGGPANWSPGVAKDRK